jgi:hypothetical protein
MKKKIEDDGIRKTNSFYREKILIKTKQTHLSYSLSYYVNNEVKK